MRRALLRWYDRHHRRLPWRANPGALAEPYHVLVSEFMLQQTQVATAVDHFERFVARWPTVADLAAAHEQAVLAAWQGLGYYRRARHLHAAARTIVADHGGHVPDRYDALVELAGVGRYTAAAIASIAFGRPVAVVDGNVIRVMARLHRIAEPTDKPAGRAAVEHAASALVGRSRRPGDVNQAMMELGATVCLPTSPRCLRCPLRNRCEAAAAGDARALPIKAGRTVQQPVRHDVVAIEHRGRLLFEQRGDGGLWAGMWQLPTHEGGHQPLADWLAERLGGCVGRAAQGPQAMHEVGRFTHLTTHRRITFYVHRVRLKGRRPAVKGRPTCWRRIDAVGDLPMSNAQRRALAILEATAATAPARY